MLEKSERYSLRKFKNGVGSKLLGLTIMTSSILSMGVPSVLAEGSDVKIETIQLVNADGVKSLTAAQMNDLVNGIFMTKSEFEKFSNDLSFIIVSHKDVVTSKETYKVYVGKIGEKLVVDADDLGDEYEVSYEGSSISENNTGLSQTLTFTKEAQHVVFNYNNNKGVGVSDLIESTQFDEFYNAVLNDKLPFVWRYIHVPSDDQLSIVNRREMGDFYKWDIENAEVMDDIVTFDSNGRLIFLTKSPLSDINKIEYYQVGSLDDEPILETPKEGDGLTAHVVLKNSAGDVISDYTEFIAYGSPVRAPQMDGFRLLTNPDKEFDIDMTAKTINVVFEYEEITSDDTTDKPSAEKLDNTTDKPSAEKSDDTTDKPFDEESDNTTDKPSAEKLDNATDKSSDEKLDDTTDKSSDEKLDDTTDKSSDEKLDDTTDKSSDEKSDDTTDKPSDEKSNYTNFSLDSDSSLSPNDGDVDSLLSNDETNDNKSDDISSSSDSNDADGNGLTSDEEEALAAKKTPVKETTGSMPLPQTNEKSSNAQMIAISMLSAIGIMGLLAKFAKKKS